MGTGHQFARDGDSSVNPRDYSWKGEAGYSQDQRARVVLDALGVAKGTGRGYGYGCPQGTEDPGAGARTPSPVKGAKARSPERAPGPSWQGRSPTAPLTRQPWARTDVWAVCLRPFLHGRRGAKQPWQVPGRRALVPCGHLHFSCRGGCCPPPTALWSPGSLRVCSDRQLHVPASPPHCDQEAGSLSGQGPGSFHSLHVCTVFCYFPPFSNRSGTWDT